MEGEFQGLGLTKEKIEELEALEEQTQVDSSSGEAIQNSPGTFITTIESSALEDGKLDTSEIQQPFEAPTQPLAEPEPSSNQDSQGTPISNNELQNQGLSPDEIEQVSELEEESLGETGSSGGATVESPTLKAANEPLSESTQDLPGTFVATAESNNTGELTIGTANADIIRSSPLSPISFLPLKVVI